MLLIPAVDLKGGKCVRLLHGDAKKETVYSDNPIEMARKWVDQGTERLHVIDLDGAFTGEPKNLDLVLRIKKETGVKVQMGGGLRSYDVVSKVLDGGVDFAILGTVVFTDPAETKKIFQAYGNRIMVAMDTRDGNVSIKGWTAGSGVTIDQALKTVEELGGQDIIFTDIGRDGTLQGVNLASVKDVMQKTKLNIFASGGVTTLTDIENLKNINSPGCILGKALYEGKINLAEAFKITQPHVS